MLDKLAIRTKLNRDKLNQWEVLGRLRPIKDPHYQDAYVLLQGQAHRASLHLTAHSKCHYPDKVVVNPAKFGGITELQQFLEGLISGHQITRIDCAADTQISVTSLHKVVLVRRKRLALQYYQGDITGFTIGKHPNQFKIYDRRLRHRRTDDGPSDTRIESSLCNQKCPVTNISELSKLLELNPFQGLELKRIDEMLNLSPREKWKFQLLEAEISRHGLQNAYKNLNKHGRNFRRDFDKFLIADQVHPSPLEIFRDDLREFLADEWTP